MGSKLRNVFAKGVDALRRKSLDSDAVVESMREGVSNTLKDWMVGADAVVPDLINRIQGGDFDFLDEDDDQDCISAHTNNTRRDTMSTTSIQSSLGDEHHPVGAHSDQDHARHDKSLGTFSKRAL